MYNSDEHRLEDPAYIQSPYPRFYQGLWPEPEAESNEFEETSPSGKSTNRSNEHYDLDCTLWVGNVDGRVSETVLFELFCQIGSIRNITFPQKKPDGDQATTFCFINFMVADSVPKSIEIMQGTTLFGRRLFLKCRPNSIHSLKPTTTAKKPNRVVHLSTTKTFSNQNAQQYQNKKPQKSSAIVVNQNEDGNRSSYSKSDSGNNSNTDSPPTKKKFSPIRAPSPIDHNNNNNKNKQGGGGRLKFSKQTPTDNNNTTTKKAVNRKVIIKSTAGTKVPTITVSEPMEPTVNSVVKKIRPKNSSNLNDNNKKKEGDNKVIKNETKSPQSDTNNRNGNKSIVENNKNTTLLASKIKNKVTNSNKIPVSTVPKSAAATTTTTESLLKPKRSVTATKIVPTTPNSSSSSKITNNPSNSNQVSPYQQQQQYGVISDVPDGRYPVPPAYNPRFHGPPPPIVDQNQVRPQFSYFNSRYRFYGHPSQQHEYHPQQQPQNQVQQQQQQQYGYHQQYGSTFPPNYNPNYYQYYDYGNNPPHNNPRYLNPVPQQQHQYTPRCTTTFNGGGPRFTNRQYVRPNLQQQQSHLPPPTQTQQQQQFNNNNNMMYQHNTNPNSTSGTNKPGTVRDERSHFGRSPRRSKSRSYSRSPGSRSGSRRRKFSRFERSRSSSYEDYSHHSRNRSRYRSRSADSRSSSNKSSYRRRSRSRSNSREHYRHVENNELRNMELKDGVKNSGNSPSESRATIVTAAVAAAKKVGRVSIKKVATKNKKSSSEDEDDDDSSEESMDENQNVNTIPGKVKDTSSSSSSDSDDSEEDDSDSDDDEEEEEEENSSVQKNTKADKAVANSGQNTKTLTTTKVVRKVKTIRKYDPTHPAM